MLRLALSVAILISVSDLQAQPSKENGLLWGSIYGDSFGGPYEFKKVSYHPLIHLDKKLNSNQWQTLAKSVRLIDYPMKASPYGAWTDYAPAGTITDDSRHKIIYWNARVNNRVSRRSLAKSYTLFHKKKTGMYSTWLDQYVRSAWYVLDKNNPLSMPLERLWGGVPTQAGQMIFLLEALSFPNDPIKAYKYTYKINYIDQGVAKDYTSSVVAGLSYALAQSATWNGFKLAMINTDPYQYSKIPYVKREISQCILMAQDFVKMSKGVPKSLYKILEENLQAKTWWEAKTSFVASLAFLEMAYQNDNPMAALALVKDFGHDTDSYAQIVGAVIGALEGIDKFNPNEIKLIQDKIKVEFGDVLGL